jgi:hypothetical protein
MAKGYRWVRVQVPDGLHDRAMKKKGTASWDDIIVLALIAWLGSRHRRLAQAVDQHRGFWRLR